MMVTANGRPVLAMTMTLPLSGLWVASLEVDSEVIEGAVALEQEGLSYAGYVVASGVVAGLCRVEVVGGAAGGLVATLEARSYRDATVRTVAGELLASVGESLDATSTRSVTGASLPYWTRAGTRATTALNALAASQVARWRVLPSGAVWLGLDAWQTAFDGEALELDRDYPAGSVLVACDTISIVPGMTIGADRVGRVEHHFGRDEALRTTYWTVP